MITKDDIDALYAGLSDTGNGEYKPMSGRTIYDQLLLSGMNVLPINILTSYITRGATVDDPLPASLVSDQLLIEGSVLLLNDNLNGWHFEDNIVYAEPGLACQQWYSNLTEPITREYRLVGDEWIVTDYLRYNKVSETGEPLIYEQPGQKPIPPIPARDVKLYINKLTPSGLLYPAQRTLYQIEQIYQTKAILTDETVGTNFFVNYSGSTTKLKSALQEKRANVALPQGTELLKAGGSNLYDQLLRDEKVTVQNYLALMHLVIPDTLERVSGVAMRYSLTPQTNFVEKVRNEVTKIYAMFGKEIAFEKTSLKSTTEIMELTNSYIAAYQAGAIAQNDLTTLMRELYQL